MFHFEFGFYSSLLLIFFVHGAVYSILLYRKALKQGSNADKWLSVFLILCIFYITPWMVGFAGWYNNQPYRDILFYVPFQQLFFLGPVIFFYTQSLLNPSFHFGKKESLHLIPGMLYLTFCIIMFVTDKVVLGEYFFLENGQDPDFDSWYQYAGFLSMLFYFFLSLRYYMMYRKIIVQAVSYADVVLFRWVRNFLIAFLSMLVLRVIFLIATLIPAFEALAYAGPWWEYFSFAIIFYYIAITGYSNAAETKVAFRINLFEYKKAILLLTAPVATNEQKDHIEDGQLIDIDIQETKTLQSSNESNVFIIEWKSRILNLLQTEKIYEDPELSLTQMAKLLQTNASILSKIINQGFGYNFNDFINHYRIEAVKEKLQAGEQKTQTLLGIGYDCGFNSKATFNRAFKKATGLSPKEWMEKSGIN